MHEAYTEYRRAQKLRRSDRLPTRTARILSLRRRGFTVRQLTPYCFRVDERMDLYPIHNRFHDIKTGERGGYPDPYALIAKLKGAA